MKKVRTRKLLAMLITLTLAFTMVLPMNFTASAATEVIIAEDFNDALVTAWQSYGSIYLWSDYCNIEDSVYKSVSAGENNNAARLWIENTTCDMKKIEISGDVTLNTLGEGGYIFYLYDNDNQTLCSLATYENYIYFGRYGFEQGEIKITDKRVENGTKFSFVITVDVSTKRAHIDYKFDNDEWVDCTEEFVIADKYGNEIFDSNDYIRSINLISTSGLQYDFDNFTVKNLSADKISSVSQTYTSIENNAKNIGLNNSISVTFDNTCFDLADLQSYVKLLDANNIEVATTKAWNNTTKTYTLTPVSPLSGQSKYTLTTAGLKDNDGNDVLDTGSVVFYTIAEPRVLKNQLTDWTLGEGFTLESNEINVAKQGASATYSSLMLDREKDGIFEIELELTSSDWSNTTRQKVFTAVDGSGREVLLLLKNGTDTYGGHHRDDMAVEFIDNIDPSGNTFTCITCNKKFTYVPTCHTYVNDVMKYKYEINTLENTINMYYSKNGAEYLPTGHNGGDGTCTGQGTYSFKIPLKELRLYSVTDMPYTLKSYSVTDYTPLVGMDVDITVDGDAYTDGAPLTAGEKAVAAVFKNVNKTKLETASVILAMYGADKSLKEVAAVSIPDGLGYAETKTIADLNWTAAAGDFIRAFHWNSFTKLTPLSRAE